MSTRFIRFNVVGLFGFVVQLAALWGLVHGGVHYLVATGIAVEAAVLHNYLWHERRTWRERDARGRDRLRRLGGFHLLNGAISLAGNLALMRMLVGTWHLPPVAANLIAVVACSVINFAVSDRLVFRVRPSLPLPSPTEASVPRT